MVLRWCLVRREYGRVEALLVGLGLAAVGLAVCRAITQAMTIDEASTYEVFVSRPTPSHWYPASNNHVLNSLLMRGFVGLFGLSHLSVRAAALCGAAIYVFVSFQLCRFFKYHPAVRIAVFVCLVFNPLVGDFFVAARGYSLALAFWMLALLLSVRRECLYAGEANALRITAWSSLCLGLSFCSNFSFAIVGLTTAGLFMVLDLLSMRSQPRTILRVCAWILPGLASVFVIPLWTLVHWPPGQFWYGAHSLNEMLGTLAEASTFEPNPYLANPFLYSLLHRLRYVLVPSTVLLAVAHGIGIIFALRSAGLRRQRHYRLLGALVAILLMSIVGHAVALKVAGVLLPKGRTAIFLVPLFTLSIAFAATRPAGPARVQRVIRAALLGHIYLLAVFFLFCVRLNYFEEWRYLADVKDAYVALADYGRKYQTGAVPTSWHYGPSLNFYRKLYPDPPFEEFVSPLVGQTYPKGRRAYVLYLPFDRQFVTEEALKIIYQGSSGVVVAVSTSRGTLQDVTENIIENDSKAIHYHGEWITDTQFSEATAGTVTYSNHVGDFYEFRFHGVGVTMTCTMAPNRGRADVHVDGKKVRTIDLYSPTVRWQVSIPIVAALRAGQHELRVQIRPDADHASISSYIDVDRIEVLPYREALSSRE